MSVDRRELFRIIGAGVVAGNAAAGVVGANGGQGNGLAGASNEGQAGTSRPDPPDAREQA